MLNEGEVSRQNQPMACGGGGIFNHFRDEPEGLVGVTGRGSWPVGAGSGPMGSEGASLGRRGLGVERSTVWVAGALGVSGAGRPSSPTSMASSLTQIPCLFFFSFFFYHAFIVFRYKKLRAALAMERTKPINQSI